MVSDTLSLAEFAQAVGVSTRTVSRWIEGEHPLVRATQSTEDRRLKAIPRSELERLVKARQGAEQRAYSAGGAAGVLEAHWRLGYGGAVREMGEVGAALDKHLRTAGAAHAPDRCAECAGTVDRLVEAVEKGRSFAALAPVAVDLYRTVHTAAREADEARSALRQDTVDA